MPPAYAAYNGLLALQHRGQESCGIAVNDRGVVSYHKDMGLVSEVFHPKDLDKLSGQMCVSHVRYSTAGDSVPENAQPLVMRYIKGTLAIAHNGNLTNAHEIRRELEHRGAIFQTTIDSEVIAYIIARERMHSGSIEEAVRRTMPQIQGAYSLLVMSPQKLIAASCVWAGLAKDTYLPARPVPWMPAARNLSGMWNREKSWWWIPAG